MDLKLLPNNAMTFTENQHGNAVLEKLRQQRELIRCCDVILHVDGKQFHAHRCVLSACSPYFDSLFKANKTVKEQLTINADSAEVFHILLAYMYTGTVIVDKKNVSELLMLANKLLLTKLKEYCAEYLQRYLDTKNCLTVLKMADKYHLESLQKTASSHITAHIVEVIEGEEILEIPFLSLENFMKNPKWNLSNEEILSLSVFWVSHSPESRESNFRSLLTWISWQDINPEQVVKLINEHPLFSHSHKCYNFLIEVLNENGLLCQPAYVKLTDLQSRERELENRNLEEDGEKFINMAISTAISDSTLSDPNVDKYLLDGGKELARTSFSYSEQNQMEIRDFSQIKNGLLADFQQYSYGPGNQISKNAATPNVVASHSNGSMHSQSFDVEEVCKYTIENTQKKTPYSFEVSDDEYHVNMKHFDYETNSYKNSAAASSCYHFRDHRDSDHYSVQNCEKCPKLTNKVSYMNHKYDASCFNLGMSFEDMSHHKNFCGPQLSPTNIQFDLNKENPVNLVGGNCQDSVVAIPFSQESHNHSLCSLSPNSYKKCQHPSGSDIIIPNENPIPSSLFENSVNLSSFPEFKSSSIMSNHHELLYMDHSNDTQSSSNYPQDMSLTHLKLNDCNYGLIPENNRVKSCLEVEGTLLNSGSFTPNDINEESNSFQSNANISQPIQTCIQSICLEEGQKSDSVAEAAVNNEERNSVGRKSPGEDETQKVYNTRRRRTNANKAVIPKVVKTCELCNQNFDRKKDYFVHMTEHFPGPPHRCDTCDSTFKKIYYLLDHRLIHSENKPFKCTQCTFATRKMFNLKEHMLLHEKVRQFKCEQCDASFRRKYHLIGHFTKHTKDRPLICETCGWSAKTRNSLLSHSKIHTGDLYSCQYPDCAYRTAKKSHLKDHMQFHTNSRPYACKVCSLSFRSKYHVQRHLLKHEASQLYQCPHCDYCPSRLDNLKIHIKRKHSATKPKLKQRKGQLKKKDALLTNTFTNKKNDVLPNVISNEQTLFSSLNGGGRISPSSTLPTLSSTISQYPAQPSSPTFGTPGDPDDPLTIVSEMEDDNQSLTSFNQTSYLDPHIGQAFSGLLDPPCDAARFTLSANDDIYYS